MKTFKKTLIELHACKEAMIWIGNKDFKTFYDTCDIGDWLLWLYARTNKEDLKGLTLAKAHCANTVRHLMTDKRSTDSIDVAILFGEGKATLEQLKAAAAYYASASLAASETSYSSAYSAYSAAQNQQLTADICRKYLPIENFNINF